MKLKRQGLILLLCFSVQSLVAQFSITSGGTDFIIDFNSYDGSTLSPTSPGITSNDWAISGLRRADVDFGGTGDSRDFRGTAPLQVDSGGVYAFEVDTGDYALGFQPRGRYFTPGSMTLRIQNNTGGTITSLDMFHNLYVLNDTNRSTDFSFERSANNSTFTTVANYTSTLASSGAPVEWLQLQLDVTFTDVSIAPGDFYYFRWSTDDGSGSGQFRDQFAIDNITMNAEVIPEPSTYVLILGFASLALVLWKRSRRKASDA